MAKTMLYVTTGEVRTGGSDIILNSGAIGSCVVITAYDSLRNIGAMAHIMLPGMVSLKNQLYATRYAINAIDEMLSQLKGFNAKIEDIDICIVGGANVLKRENDTIGRDNLESVKRILREKKLEINAEAIGGFERSTVVFDIAKGCVYHTMGDSIQKILWQTKNNFE